VEKKFASNRITPRQLLISGFLSVVSSMSAVSAAGAEELKADALLQIDMNRAAVVDRVMATWSSEMRGSENAMIRAGLSGLRADKLLAVSLAGSYEGVLEAMLGRASLEGGLTASSQSFSQLSPAIGSARASHAQDFQAVGLSLSSSRDRSKAEGDKLVYTPVTPCRLHDSRVGQTSAIDPLFKTPMANQSTRTIVAGGKCGIPASGVKALFFSFHSYNNNPAALGVITFQKTGTPVSGLAAAWTGQVWSVGTVITETLDDGSFDAFVGNSVAMTADMIIDVQGYFSASSSVSTTGLNITQTTVNNQTFSTVVLGSTFNTASGLGASVLGGGGAGSTCLNPTTGAADYLCPNRAAGDYATVVGGIANSSNASTASVFGGQSNVVSAANATVLGGQQNIASEQNATIVGGRAGRASSFRSVVVGGDGNTASGIDSVAMGGGKNVAAGNASFAGGTRAFTKANATAATGHNGAFVWADTTNGDFFSEGNNQFAVRATGGVRFVTGIAGDGTTVTGSCSLPAGGAPSWSCPSDRNLKESITGINPREILNRVVSLPLSTWQYKGVARRHLSPMAQDFWAAFGLGVDDKSIVSTDVGGVALAAVQGVNQKLNEEVSALKSQNAKLQKELAVIKKKLGL
jgi:hypothetical protein